MLCCFSTLLLRGMAIMPYIARTGLRNIVDMRQHRQCLQEGGYQCWFISAYLFLYWQVRMKISFCVWPAICAHKLSGQKYLCFAFTSCWRIVLTFHFMKGIWNTEKRHREKHYCNSRCLFHLSRSIWFIYPYRMSTKDVQGRFMHRIRCIR